MAFSPPDGRLPRGGKRRGGEGLGLEEPINSLHSLPGHEHHSIPRGVQPRRAAPGDGRRLAGRPEALGRGNRAAAPHRRPHIATPSARWRSARTASGWPRPASTGRVNVWDATTGELLHTLAAYRKRPGRRLQPGRPAPRLERRRQDGARLGRGDRPGGARPARTHRQVRVRGVQPGRPAPRLGQRGRDHPRLGRDPAAGGRGPGRRSPSQRHDDEVRSVAVSPDGRADCFGRPRRAREGLGRGDRPSRASSSPATRRHCLLRGLAPRRPAHRLGRLGRSPVLRQGLGRADRTRSLRDPGRAGHVAVPFTAVAFSPDGRYLVTGKQDGAVQVWDAGTGEPVGTLGTHDREIRGVVVQPRRPAPGVGERRRDGETVGRDAAGQATWTRSRSLAARFAARVPGPSLNVAFSPDGRAAGDGG